MTDIEIYSIVRSQLSKDYSCREDEFYKKGLTISKKEPTEGRRIYDNDGCFLKLACFGDKALLSADEKILDYCKKNNG